MEPADLETIKQVVQEFFDKMGFEVGVEVLSFQEQTLPVNITSEEPRILIGEKGQTMAEIQHLLNLIVRKKTGTAEPLYLNLDINEYKKKKTAYLQELVRDIAQEVALTKKERVLPPMSAYERRVVHMELADRSDVASESFGQDQDRRIVIKPKILT